MLTLRTYDGNGRIPIPETAQVAVEMERLGIAARAAERRAELRRNRPEAEAGAEAEASASALKRRHNPRGVFHRG